MQVRKWGWFENTLQRAFACHVGHFKTRCKEGKSLDCDCLPLDRLGYVNDVYVAY